MKIKGLIFALGPWSCAHSTALAPDLSGIPKILLSLKWLMALGIEQFLICATAHEAAQIHSVLFQCQLPAVKISYLLADEATSVAASVTLASEYFEQSKMVLTGAGVYCCHALDSSQSLRTGVKRTKGAAAFRLRNGNLLGSNSVPEILVLDATTRSSIAAKQSQLSLGQSIHSLRRHCLQYHKYLELQCAPADFYINLNEDLKLSDSDQKNNVFNDDLQQLVQLSS